eukprot:731143-Rhodomonas_salina.3
MQALQNLNIKGGAGAGDAKGLSDPSSGSRAPAPPAARRGAEAAAPRERGRGGGRGGGAGVGQRMVLSHCAMRGTEIAYGARISQRTGAWPWRSLRSNFSIGPALSTERS